ncbi:MAG: hypothetical protein JST24_05750 [Acidobacteria bacterium]|nr:hypothetical protein [Acidobacteriota bacterium]
MGAFLVILIVLAVIYFAMRGKGDRPEQLGAAKRGMTSGRIGDGHTFVCPYAKCPTCGASGDGMKSAYDEVRTVKWTCGYCGAQAGIQELKDEELPPAARRRLGLDPDPAMLQQQGFSGMGQGMGQMGQGPNLGGLLTGVILGEMLGGGHRSSSNSGGGWDASGSSDQGQSQDWGESDASSGSDWGDSGGGDSGGSDW